VRLEDLTAEVAAAGVSLYMLLLSLLLLLVALVLFRRGLRLTCVWGSFAVAVATMHPRALLLLC
jgi:hypothetical protein